MTKQFLLDQKHQNSDRLKRDLIDVVEREKGRLVECAQAFYNNETHTQEDYITLCRSIVTTLNGVLNARDWNSSLFLRSSLKSLKELRDRAMQLLEDANEQTSSDEEMDQIYQPTSGNSLVHVYISVFQSDGHNLQQWEVQLRSIDQHIHGRPIYAQEEQIQQAMRLKASPFTDAYVVVAIPDSVIEINAEQSTRKDRFGNALLTLRSGAVTARSIIRFVHQGIEYAFKDSQLRKIVSKG